MSTKPKAILALENGMVFEGTSFGSSSQHTGEVVFNTSMTGYQEIITDPSYKGQMVVMTYPHIGSTGINSFDSESDRIHLEALVVKEYCDTPSNWRSEKTLSQFLEEFDIPGISGIDTRKLTRVLRQEGCLRAVISTAEQDHDKLIARARSIPIMTGQNLVKLVSTKEIYEHTSSAEAAGKVLQDRRADRAGMVRAKRESEVERERKFPAGEFDSVSEGLWQQPLHDVVAIDLGIKATILKKLSESGCKVTVVPYNTSADKILSLNPDGIFLSNGPGDPAAVTETIDTAKKLIGKKPIFGICLGHQILGIALGGKTSKLKFGHHGANHPVLNQKTGSIEITAQNHNFVVDLTSLQNKAHITHVSLNDQTVEGFYAPQSQLISIQYHPEAAPGPHDSDYLFHDFKKMLKKFPKKSIEKSKEKR